MQDWKQRVRKTHFLAPRKMQRSNTRPVPSGKLLPFSFYVSGYINKPCASNLITLVTSKAWQNNLITLLSGNSNLMACLR